MRGLLLLLLLLLHVRVLLERVAVLRAAFHAQAGWRSRRARDLEFPPQVRNLSLVAGRKRVAEGGEGAQESVSRRPVFPSPSTGGHKISSAALHWPMRGR